MDIWLGGQSNLCAEIQNEGDRILPLGTIHKSADTGDSFPYMINKHLTENLTKIGSVCIRVKTNPDPRLPYKNKDYPLLFLFFGIYKQKQVAGSNVKSSFWSVEHPGTTKEMGIILTRCSTTMHTRLPNSGRWGSKMAIQVHQVHTMDMFLFRTLNTKPSLFTLLTFML